MSSEPGPDPDCVEAAVNLLRKELGPLIMAAETTQMATIFVDRIGSENFVVFANDMFLSLSGRAVGQQQDVPLNIILEHALDHHTCASIEAALAARESGKWEAAWRRVDDSVFLAKVFLTPLYGEDGAVRCYVLNLIELDGHINGGLTHQRRLHGLYADAPGFIAMTSGPEHHFTFTNASYDRFVGRCNLIGLTVREALPELVSQGIIELLDHVYESGEPYLGSSMMIKLFDPRRGKLETRYIDFVYQPARDPVGTITGLFCEGYDVTAQHEAKNALALLQSRMFHVSRVNAMGVMAATLAHELYQPLSAIGNYTAGILKVLAPDGPVSAKILSAVSGIEETTQRAADMIRNLRDLTRRRAPVRSDFVLEDAVSECVRLVRASESPDIEIDYDVASTITVNADRIQIQQVIINLLSNACAAAIASKTRKVYLSVEEQVDEVIVCVCDTGIGIPAELKNDLFAWADSPKIEGMGLGLAICRTIADAHKGRIWLSRTDSSGSEFCFSIPTGTDAAPSTAAGTTATD